MTNIGFPFVSSEVETPRRSALPMGISTSLDANGYGGCMELTPDHAARFATATLAHLGREYPYKMDLVLTGPEDATPPRPHPPIFHGALDCPPSVQAWCHIHRPARPPPPPPQHG